jgi:hypothetical protein
MSFIARPNMRPISRPLARELLLLVLATAAPAATLAAACAASVFDPSWSNALLLVLSATALAAGIYLSCLIARGLRKSLEDLAADARMLARGTPMARLEMKLGELVEIADALVAAQARMRAPASASVSARLPAPGDLAQGAQSWSRAVAARYRGGDVRPVAETVAAWCDLDGVMTRLARGFGTAAVAAGVALEFDVAPGLCAVRGATEDVERALSGLLDCALTVTSRGGAVSIAAREVAAGTVKIMLACRTPTAPGAQGISAAGNMIELTCGAALAASLARARVLIEAAGGSIDSGADTVTILLVSTLSGRKAA